MDKPTLQALYAKYRAQTLNAGERAAFRAVLADPEQAGLLDEVLDEDWHAIREEELQDVSAQRAEDLYREMIATRPESKAYRLWPRVAAAASIVLAVSAGGYFLLHKKALIQQTAQNRHGDIAPGSNKAILTLANGQKIILTGAKNGQIATQGQTVIQKTANGKVVYEPAALTPDAALTYNTISTPVTGQHQVTLSDGTEAMLDAQSSITFPVAFNTKKRRVSITGQVWFSVKHNDRQPFLVTVKGETIQDVGTEFNINAYDDEPDVKTTLVSGSIKVGGILLRPGQQAAGNGTAITVQAADTSAVVAWKEGNFIFRNQELETTMRQLARWYNVNVVYDHAPRHLHIGGYISRSRNLSVVLAAIERTGEVKFKLTGRTITVTQ